jgi:hypothetical protein
VLGKAIGGWPLAGAAEESYHRHSPDHPRVWLILRHHKSYHKIIRARAPFGLFFPSRLAAEAEALGENGAHMMDILGEPANGALGAAICIWMADKGYTTSHGAIKELLEEIDRQAIERGRKTGPSLLDPPVSSVRTRTEISRELARSPCCDACWVRPETGKAKGRYAICSNCRKTSIRWDVTTTVVELNK